MPQAQLFDQRVQTVPGSFQRREVLVDIGFRRAGKPAPHPGLHKPEKQLVAFQGVHRPGQPVEVANHHRHAEASEQHPVMVESEPSRDQVETGVDLFAGACESVLDVGALLPCR